MRGGSRKGAGRKAGSLTKRTREIADRAADEGLMPLEYMLQVMRDTEADRAQRNDMAKAAAPYIHPRLSNIEHGGKDGGPLVVNITRFGMGSDS